MDNKTGMLLYRNPVMVKNGSPIEFGLRNADLESREPLL